MNVGMDWTSLVASNRSKRCKGPILQNSSSSLSLPLRGLPSFLSLSPSRSGPVKFRGWDSRKLPQWGLERSRIAFSTENPIDKISNFFSKIRQGRRHAGLSRPKYREGPVSGLWTRDHSGIDAYTRGEVTSQNLWPRYHHHFVGITWHNVCSKGARIYRVN